MSSPKKLIEVAMPVKEVSAESVRDKSIRHGHISTLHLWWARRPLPVCRAVVFASLVPDPLDPECPQAFKDAVQHLLGPDAQGVDLYHPYEDIPYTSSHDRMADNLRNRLLMFLGKFSDDYVRNEAKGKTTPAKDMLSHASLIKWDNKNNEAIIGKARRLIWVSHNAATSKDATTLLADYDLHYRAIQAAETLLYSLPDRHITRPEVADAEAALHSAIEAYLDHMPRVFDPFAGGGAIPLEAARLGCRSYGNDINPVAHIIQKGSLEYPQKYGKPITYSVAEFLKLYGEEELRRVPNERKVYQDGDMVAVRIPNRLSFDVEFYAKKLLAMAEAEVGHLYPADENGRKPIAYYWARVGTCSNPSCGAEVPLLKGFYLVDTENKRVFLRPQYDGKSISFEIGEGAIHDRPWVHSRKTLTCPICNGVTSNKELKRQFLTRKPPIQALAVILEGKEGKQYRVPRVDELAVLQSVHNLQESPSERLAVANTKQFDLCQWGYTTVGDMYSQRQLLVMNALLKANSSSELFPSQIDLGFKKAIRTYLAIWLDRVFIANTSFGRWHIRRETLELPISKQAIAMTFDFPESNPFCDSTGGALNQLDWLTRYIDSESPVAFASTCINASSGDREQFQPKSLTSVITDPPYYDAIAYADLSDFFYAWLKRSISDEYPSNFSTPQTPKEEECTALKYHRGNDKKKAKEHFEKKLLQIFDAIEHQTAELVSIMFAHQSTEAWTTLCDSILGARMNITGSWAIDTELANRTVGLAGAALESSVTVSARPAQRQGIGSYREVKKAIERTVEKEVEELYQLGFRGADLLTACFGQAVSEFGKYERVEKADGTEVTVAELLEMARESAFNALLKGFDGDEYTKFYIGWLQLYGFAETDFDDAAKFARVGLTIDVNELFTTHVLLKHGNKQRLGQLTARLGVSPKLGEATDSPLIDQAHRAMHLWSGDDRGPLLRYIQRSAASAESPLWRVLTSLVELLPSGSEDHKLAAGLLSNKDSLLRDSKQMSTGAQIDLFGPQS